MEKEIDYNEVVRRKIRKVLQEALPNPTRVGRVFKNPTISFLWQPHNYRLYFDWNRESFNPPKPDNPTLKEWKVGLVGFTYEAKNYNSEHHFNNFWGCRVILRKNMAEVINKRYDKQWTHITAGCIEDIDNRIDERVEKLDKQAEEALKKIIHAFGGRSEYKVLKKRGEHGIHGDDYLDSIPEDMVIHDTVFKKEYKKKSELYTIAGVKNHMSNSVTKKIAPEIAAALKAGMDLSLNILETNKSTAEALQSLSDPIVKLNELTLKEIENKKLHMTVLNDMRSTLKDISTSMKPKEKKRPKMNRAIKFILGCILIYVGVYAGTAIMRVWDIDLIAALVFIAITLPGGWLIVDSCKK